MQWLNPHISNSNKTQSIGHLTQVQYTPTPTPLEKNNNKMTKQNKKKQQQNKMLCVNSVMNYGPS